MNTYTMLRFPGFWEKAVTLSYDDGVMQDVRLMEILNRYGLKCTFNINSGLFAQTEGTDRLTEPQAISLYKGSGHEVAVHGVGHLPMGDVPIPSAVSDIIHDRVRLEQDFDCIVQGMAYANGSYSDEAVQALKLCGVKYARTIEATGNFAIPGDWLRLHPTCHHNDPRLFTLAEQFLKDYDPNTHFWWRAPKLFYLWGHSYEFDRNGNWDRIEKFASMVGNQEDVWYATNGEVYDYVTAFDRLEFSANNTRVHNPSAIDVYISYFGRNYYIPSGKTVEMGK